MNEDSIRELFIEELVEVQGGAPEASAEATLDTTQACCEELIWDDCCL
ncbi:MAG: hypothetical protein M3N53_12825 [Actinomycetota bacterium]|nr:hypothetical protein [Actinomycetota bacterium]